VGGRLYIATPIRPVVRSGPSQQRCCGNRYPIPTLHVKGNPISVARGRIVSHVAVRAGPIPPGDLANREFGRPAGTMAARPRGGVPFAMRTVNAIALPRGFWAENRCRGCRDIRFAAEPAPLRGREGRSPTSIAGRLTICRVTGRPYTATARTEPRCKERRRRWWLRWRPGGMVCRWSERAVCVTGPEG